MTYVTVKAYGVFFDSVFGITIVFACNCQFLSFNIVNLQAML